MLETERAEGAGGEGRVWGHRDRALDRCSPSCGGGVGGGAGFGEEAGGWAACGERLPSAGALSDLDPQLPWQTGGCSASQTRCLTPALPRVGQAETPRVTGRTDPKRLSYLPELKPASGTPGQALGALSPPCAESAEKGRGRWGWGCGRRAQEWRCPEVPSLPSLSAAVVPSPPSTFAIYQRVALPKAGACHCLENPMRCLSPPLVTL